ITTLLSGEYNCLVDNSKEPIKKLEEKLIEISGSISVDPANEIQGELQSVFWDNIIVPFSYTLKLDFDYLIRDIKQQLNLEYKRQLLRVDKVEGRKNTLDNQVRDFSQLYRICLQVTRIEHFMFSENEEL